MSPLGECTSSLSQFYIGALFPISMSKKTPTLYILYSPIPKFSRGAAMSPIGVSKIFSNHDIKNSSSLPNIK